MKKLKDEQFREMTIKVDRVREVEKIGQGSYSYKDTMYLVDIINYTGGGLGFSVKIGSNYGAGLRKLFREIVKHLHLS